MPFFACWADADIELLLGSRRKRGGGLGNKHFIYRLSLRSMACNAVAIGDVAELCPKGITGFSGKALGDNAAFFVEPGYFQHLPVIEALVFGVRTIPSHSYHVALHQRNFCLSVDFEIVHLGHRKQDGSPLVIFELQILSRNLRYRPSAAALNTFAVLGELQHQASLIMAGITPFFLFLRERGQRRHGYFFFFL